MTNLTYKHITAPVPTHLPAHLPYQEHHILINLYWRRAPSSPLPSRQVLEKTAHLYQPGARRPYGELEWPAMLRLLEAAQKTSAFPPYWT